MCVKSYAAGIAAALSVAALVFTPNEAAAKPVGAGWGAHGAFKFKSAPFIKRHALHHRRAFRRTPIGGVFAGFWPGYDPGYQMGVIGDWPTVQRIDPYLPAPASLTCHRSREIVTVPVEGGGERKIGVTRC
jgi:hypothetical protein